jgi:hypothetical protein
VKIKFVFGNKVKKQQQQQKKPNGEFYILDWNFVEIWIIPSSYPGSAF